jgi:hypothetical protein
LEATRSSSTGQKEARSKGPPYSGFITPPLCCNAKGERTTKRRTIPVPLR